jgi:hypothetical protein
MEFIPLMPPFARVVLRYLLFPCRRPEIGAKFPERTVTFSAVLENATFDQLFTANFAIAKNPNLTSWSSQLTLCVPQLAVSRTAVES